MKTGGIAFGGSVAFAFLCQDMYQDWSLQVAHILKSADEAVQTVPLDGADVMKVKRLEEHTRSEKRHQHVFTAPQELQNV